VRRKEGLPRARRLDGKPNECSSEQKSGNVTATFKNTLLSIQMRISEL